MRPIFVIEYKAAHKIDEDLLRSTLKSSSVETFMEDVIKGCHGSMTDMGGPQRDIAKVFTQTYHYMVDYRLQYSYATTGIALIFLYLDPMEPSTLYYHMEEPKKDAQKSDREGFKHSAVGLVLSFVLMAMQGQHMTSKWKKAIVDGQTKWPFPYKDMGFEVNEISLRGRTIPVLKPQTAASCGVELDQISRHQQDPNDDDDMGGSGFGGDPHQASGTRKSVHPSTAGTNRSSSKKRKASGGATEHGSKEMTIWSRPVDAPITPALEYCTQACLLGLKTGNIMDLHCPNYDLHRRRIVHDGGVGVDGKGSDMRHPISASDLRKLLVQQLAEDMDNDFQSLERFGMYGAIGALFKIALTDYGYCFVGKGVQRPHRQWLEQEAATYDVLEACQGRLVPVNLGVIALVDEFWTECGAHISHMMLMSFAGESLWHWAVKARDHCRNWKKNRDQKISIPLRVLNWEELYNSEGLRTLKELELYGVEHGDENERNMAWNEEVQRVMAIDLDRAIVWQSEQSKRRNESIDKSTLQTKRVKV